MHICMSTLHTCTRDTCTHLRDVYASSQEVPRSVCDALRGYEVFWKVPRKFPGGYVMLCEGM